MCAVDSSILPLWLLAVVAVQAAQVTPPAPVSSVQQSYSNTSHCDCVCGQHGRKMRIVGGEEAEVHEFPWIVYLSYRGKFYCGGTLITARHVLTAAHCTQQIRAEHITVTLGDHNRNDSASSVEVRKVVKMIPHKRFTLNTFNSDIAILQLDRPVTTAGSAIRPACLPVSDDTDYAGRSAVVAGWGRLAERKKTSESLMKVNVPILSLAECKSKGYPDSKITDGMICAGYSEGKKDACQGDSGGPLHANDANNVTEVIGIVSWGRGCARPNFPGVYTRVARYMEWIDEHLDGECRCTKRPPPRRRQPRIQDMTSSSGSQEEEDFAKTLTAPLNPEEAFKQ